MIGIVIAVIALAVLGYLYVRHEKAVTEAESREAVMSAVRASSPYSMKVSGLTLTLSKNGTPIQTLTLGEDATAGMSLISGSTIGVDPFITTDDINFDGYPDVAMLTGLGYGGVNLFYDYYEFDPATERLVADPVLSQVGNPIFDKATKTITGDAKDAQDSFKTVYTWNGKAYVKGLTISDTTGQVQQDD